MKDIKYLVQIREINGKIWDTKNVFLTLQEAIKSYNFYKAGCEKRILKVTYLEPEYKVVRSKKY